MLRPSLIASILLATPLVAQETTDVEAPEAVAPEVAAEVLPQVMIRADDIEDALIYSLADTYDENFWGSGDPFGPVSADWGEIGEVENVIIDDAGQVLGVTVEVGGFLGIGEKTVLIPLEDLRLVQRPEDEGFFIVTRVSNEQFEEAEDMSGDFVDADE